MATTSTAKLVLTAEDRASRVIGQVRDQMQSASAAAGHLAGSVGLINPAFAGLAGVAGLAAFVKHVLNARDALNDVADATGASVESLSALERVARLNGSTLDDVGSILFKFNSALKEAGSDPESGPARVFKALGLSIKELQASDPAKALQSYAVALAGFADSGAKSRGEIDVLGKSSKAAAALLRDLADAGEVVGSVTTEQAKQAERYNKALNQLKLDAEDAARSLMQSLQPALTAVAESMAKAAKPGAFGSFLQELSAEFKSLQLKVVVSDIEALTGQLSRATPGSSSANTLAALLKDARLRYDQLSRSAAGANEKLKSSVDLLSGGTPNNSPVEDRRLSAGRRALVVPGKAVGLAGPPKEQIDQAAKALEQYIKQLDAELVKVQELSAVEEARIKLSKLGAYGQSVVSQEVVLGLAREIDLRKQGAEFAKAMTAEMTRQADEVSAIDRDLMQFSGRTADALKQARSARLQFKIDKGEVFTPEELDRIVKGIGGIEIQAKDTTDTMAKMLDQFARNAQDALGDTLEATLRGNFDSIEQLWGNLLLKMAAQAAAAQIGQALFGDFAKSGDLGGVFGSVLGAFGFGPGKANGGSVGAMSLQRVNERGFEVFTSGGQDWLMTGGRGGVVTPASQVNMAAPQAGPIVHVTNNVQAGVTRGEVTAAVQFGMQQALQTMRAELRAQRVLA